MGGINRNRGPFQAHAPLPEYGGHLGLFDSVWTLVSRHARPQLLEMLIAEALLHHEEELGEAE